MLSAIKNFVASVPPAVIAIVVLAVAAVLVWLWRRRSAAKSHATPPKHAEKYHQMDHRNQMALADANAAMYASTVRDGLDRERSTVAPIMIPAVSGDIEPTDVVPDDIYDREDDGMGGGEYDDGADGEYDDGGEYDGTGGDDMDGEYGDDMDGEYEPME